MFDEFVVSLSKQVQGVFVSHLEGLHLAHDHLVHYSQVIVDCLVKHIVVDDGIDLFRGVPETVDTIYVDVLDGLVKLIPCVRVWINLLDHHFEERN